MMPLRLRQPSKHIRIELSLEVDGKPLITTGTGNGPLDASMDGLGTQLRIQHYEERALPQGADAKALAIAELAGSGLVGAAFGAAIHNNLITASIRAVISAVNCAWASASEKNRETFSGFASAPAGRVHRQSAV